MLAIPDPAVVGLAATTLSALVLGGGLLRYRRRDQDREDAVGSLRSGLTGTRSELRAARAELASARAEVERASQVFTDELLHLARERMPAAATRAVHPHFQVPGALLPDSVCGELGTSLGEVLDSLTTALVRERVRVDSAACAGMRGATREIQAGLYRLQDVVRGLQHRYDDPELSHTLYSLDHENEQSLRRAQVTAVVCGAWVGLARDESHVVDAVVGGQSRLIGYHRIKVGNHLEEGTALISHAVEPVAIIVAELLDNALRHSAADAEVMVTLAHAHHGITITVDDAGVGMGEEERAYAQRMVAGSDPILLSELGDPPRMGLAAIGQLTRQFDLSVDLSSRSPYGGVRGVLMVKNHLVTRLDPVRFPPSPASPRSTLKSRPVGRFPAPPRTGPDGPVSPPGAVGTPRGVRPSPRPSSPHRPASPPSPHAPAAPHSPPSTRAPLPSRTPVTAADPGRPGAHSFDAITHEPAPAPGAAPDDGLLPRRRRRVRPAAHPAEVQLRPPAPPRRTPEEAAAALGALQAGTTAARNAADSEGNDP
ncbi:ATP-binding protein [Streptomyces sp. NPDC057638]|uniref:ATP-binding protein n=1 Tax=Streptomyces sp. NPDC057638 TaxID=3346190 RepID=UPI0036C98D4D